MITSNIHSFFLLKEIKAPRTRNKLQWFSPLPRLVVVGGVTLKTQARGGHGLNRSEITGFFA